MFVEQVISNPSEFCLLFSCFVLELDAPKGFLPELLDLLVTLHDEPQRWKLARPIADNS